MFFPLLRVFYRFFSFQLAYTNLYCCLDVGILAEVFSQFRRVILQNYNLDCCHYISTPQMSFDCMLLLTGAEISLLSDIDQILFIENNIRGGVSYINQRHCVEQDDDEKKVELKLIDANNLYGLSQSQALPVSDFRWLTKGEIKKLDWTQTTDTQETGYILMVDLFYPEELHAAHNSFPLAPEQLEISEEMLSPYAKGEKNVLVLLNAGFEPAPTFTWTGT